VNGRRSGPAPGSPPSSFRLEEAGSPEISVRPDLFRGPSVSVDGRPVPRRRAGARSYWPIALDDGSERRLFLAGQLTGLRAIVDEREYPVERRLAGWELALAVVPIAVVTLLVGVVGLLTGGVASGVSFAIFRLPWPGIARIAAWTVAFALAVLAGRAVAPLFG
jgi:hypothetical protein